MIWRTRVFGQLPVADVLMIVGGMADIRGMRGSKYSKNLICGDQYERGKEANSLKIVEI